MNETRSALLLRAVVTLSLASCGTDLEVDGEPKIACTVDADCPSGFSCAAAIKRCRAGTVADDRGPTLLGATAIDANTVTLVFDEPLAPDSASLAASFAFAPDLIIQTVSVATDGQSVTLVTSAQLPGQTYSVTVSDVTDIDGNVIGEEGNHLTFVGFGVPPDSSPPEILSPVHHPIVRVGAFTITWTGRQGATSYAVEVASDAGFTSTLAGSPYEVAAPATSLTIDLPEAKTYYVRVRSDVMRPDDAGSVEVVSAVGEAILVYCPATDSACVDIDSAGNLSRPRRTINQALRDAIALNLSTIKIASRDGSSPYLESVSLVPGISLLGGYTSSFDEASRDPAAHPTRVAGAGSFTFVAAAIEARSTLLEGLEIVGNGSADGAALLIAGCDETLTVRNCTLANQATANRARAVLISDSATEPSHGPRLLDDVIAGTGVGLHIVRSSPSLAGSTVDVSCGANQSAAGVLVEEGNPELTDNEVSVHDCNDLAVEEVFGIQITSHTLTDAGPAAAVQPVVGANLVFIRDAALPSAAGLFVDAADAEVTGNTLSLVNVKKATGFVVENAAGAGPVYAHVEENTASVQIGTCTPTAATATSLAGLRVVQHNRNGDVVLDFVRNTLRISDVADASSSSNKTSVGLQGVEIQPDALSAYVGGIRLANNVIEVGSGYQAYGVMAQPPTADGLLVYGARNSFTVVVANNTFKIGRTNYTSGIRWLPDASGSPPDIVVVNNIFGATTAAASGSRGLFSPSGVPTSVQNNVFVGFQTVGSYNSTTYSTGAALGSSGAFVANLGNTSGLMTWSDLNLDATTNAPTTNTPASVRFSGKNASLDTCGPSGNWSCGDITNDRHTPPLTRTCPTAVTACYSMGAYELD